MAVATPVILQEQRTVTIIFNRISTEGISSVTLGWGNTILKSSPIFQYFCAALISYSYFVSFAEMSGTTNVLLNQLLLFNA